MKSLRRFLIACLAPTLICGCHQQTEALHIGGKAFGTTWDATVVAFHSAAEETQLKTLIQSRLDEFDHIFSNWRPDSDVSRFNASPSTDWQRVPSELAEVVQFAIELSRKTNGAYDVTCSPLIDLWGFGPKGRVKQPPTDDAIAATLKRCGWQKLDVQTQPPMLRKRQADLEINVSSLVEGYAADEIAKRLIGSGHSSFLLNTGEMIARGVTPEGTPWNVGIQRPFAAQGEFGTSIALRDQALATSGTYRQFFENGGKRYPHTLDARTGRPVTHDLPSVSVIDESCFKADGWATALLILGPIQGREVAKKNNLSALFIEAADTPSH